MKYRINQVGIFFILLFVLFSASIHNACAGLDATGAFSSLYQLIFGKEVARIEPASSSDCDTITANGGAVGPINGIFCHVKYDLGMVTLGKVTKVLGTGSSALTAHVEFTRTSCTGVDGNSYDLSLNIWVCPSSSCSSASQFNRFVSICYSADDKRSDINKGSAVADILAFSGTVGSAAARINYDLGASATSQFISAKTLNPNGYNFEIYGTRSDSNHLNASLIASVPASNSPSSGNSARFVFTLDRTTNTGTAYVEGFGFSTLNDGVGTWNASNSAGTPSAGVCFSRTPAGTDFTYTDTGHSSSCNPAVTFVTDSITNVSNFTYSGLVGNWQGMSANPSSI